MVSHETLDSPQVAVNAWDQWVAFPGGELEGERPKTLCRGCRDAAERLAGISRSGPDATSPPGRRTLCFQCYRAGLERERALKGAADLNTASAERYQSVLPFEPVNRSRLEMLKVERAAVRVVSLETTNRFADRRRRAQIAARHALQRVVAGRVSCRATADDRARAIAAAIHAAELQLPESWLPFVVSR
jgi:hypothetical protein